MDSLTVGEKEKAEHCNGIVLIINILTFMEDGSPSLCNSLRSCILIY